MSRPAEPVQGASDEVINPESTDPQTPPTPQEPEVKAPYAEYLDELPETIRPLVEPAFKKWDGSVTQRFQELHSQYEPWKQVVDQYQPDDVMGALQMAMILDQEPERFLAAFKESYPEIVEAAFKGQGEATPTTSTPPTSEQGLGDLDPDDPVAKMLLQMKEQLDGLTGTFTSRQEQEEAAASQQYLDQVLQQLHSEHGDFDDTYILSQMAFANKTPEQALAAWNETKTKYLSPQQTQTPAPPVIPSTNGVPTTVPDIDKMDNVETKNLVANLLAAAAQQDT